MTEPLPDARIAGRRLARQDRVPDLGIRPFHVREEIEDAVAGKHGDSLRLVASVAAQV